MISNKLKLKSDPVKAIVLSLKGYARFHACLGRAGIPKAFISISVHNPDAALIAPLKGTLDP